MCKDTESILAEEVKVGDIDLTEIFKSLGMKYTAKVKRRYLRTVPMSWLIPAMSLPGKSLAVGLVVWYLAGVSKKFAVTLSRVQLKKFGIRRMAGKRGLKNLEAAGLVKIDREGHKSPLVTIVIERI